MTWCDTQNMVKSLFSLKIKGEMNVNFLLNHTADNWIFFWAFNQQHLQCISTKSFYFMLYS